MKKLNMLLLLTLMFSVAVISASVADADDGQVVTGSGTFTVEEGVQRSLDYEEVQKVAGMHEYYHTALRHEAELNDIWAQEHEVTWKNNTDYYVGWDNLYTFYVTDLQSHITQCLKAANAIDSSIEITDDNKGAGMLWYHMLMSPVIEVAGDGQTARGVWMSFGTVTEPNGTSMTAQWTCETYGIDFVKENGKWKIWHLRLHVYFYSNVDGHWYNTSDNQAASDAGTYFTGYSLHKIAEAAEIPEPYNTWADLTTSF
jgi:hypothetical protein